MPTAFSGPRPLIGVTACTMLDGEVPFHKAGDKYVDAIHDRAATDAIPVIIPALGDQQLDMEGLLDRLDGLFFTGSPSNVEPKHFGSSSRPGTEHDPRRDATTLPLLRLALQRGLPIFCVCRGHQELNVALGGSLHQHVQELPGKRDHRSNKNVPFDARYGHCHDAIIQPGGLLEKLAGKAGPVGINSLHEQAIDRPGDGLFVEAISDDGIIEAVSLPRAKGFVLSVQWHPEHLAARQWPLSQAMFQAFGAACRSYASARLQRHSA